MITSKQEYDSKLLEIQNNLNQIVPERALLIPEKEPIYNIDLNTRIVESPEFLSVAKEHTAETIYFKVDRYYEHIDLSNTICIIEYINAADEKYLYVVPFYDVTTIIERDSELDFARKKIVFPWSISSSVTKKAGIVKYAIKFYHIDRERSNEIHDYAYDFVLNTLPAESKVLYSLDGPTDSKDEEFNDLDFEKPYAPGSIDSVQDDIRDVIQRFRETVNDAIEAGALNVFWLEV